MKDYSKIILFSDMDGTLLNSKGKVSRDNQEAIQALLERGGLFGIATGRTQLNSVLFLDDIKVNVPCIVYNGCGVYDFEAKEFIVLQELSKERILPFINNCLKEFEDIAIQIYTPDMCNFVSPKSRADAKLVANHQPCQFCQIEDIIDLPWIKIIFCGKPEELRELNGIRENYDIEQEINWVFSDEIYLEFLPYGVSKGSALAKLREHMGPAYKIYAVGDYNNDIEMIQEADVGIATQNAVSALKEIADVITVSNDESAIADVIYHLIFENEKNSR